MCFPYFIIKYETLGNNWNVDTQKVMQKNLWSFQTPFSFGQCATSSAQSCIEMHIWVHILPTLSPSPMTLDLHWINIIMPSSLFITDSWQQPHSPVGSGECVSGSEQWPFTLWGTALVAFNLGCALSSSGCCKSASQLPVGGWWLTGTSPFFQGQLLLTSDEPAVLGLLPPAFPASPARSSWALPNRMNLGFGTLCSSGAGAPSNTYCCIQVKQQPQQGLGQKLAHKLLFKLWEVG